MGNENLILHPFESLQWLKRFRLAMFFAALLSTLYVYFRVVAEVPIAFAGLALLLSLFIPLTNAFLMTSGNSSFSRSGKEEEHAHFRTGAQYVLALDAFLLTLIFHLTGGSHNPFTVIYLAQLTLSLVTLGFSGSLPTFFVSTAGFLSLFLVGLREKGEHAHHMESASSSHAAHLEGMFVAFVLVSALLLYFLRWMGREVARYRRLIAHREREKRERIQLLSLTALASQSAHELASPLSHIMLGVSELFHEIKRRGDAPHLLEEIAEVKQEVERAKKLLEQMVLRGQSLKEDASEGVTVGELLQSVQQVVSEEFSGAVELSAEVEQELELLLPRQLFANATRGVVKNSREAGATRLSVSLQKSGEFLALEFTDNGRGMSEQQLLRLGEPFISTKGVGEGMGLGIFILKLLAESIGGSLEFQALHPSGLSLAIFFPIRPIFQEEERDSIYGSI